MLRQLLILTIAAAAHAQMGNATCMDDPNREMCKDAEDFYPKTMVSTNLDALCMMMPHMPGCAIKTCCGDQACSETIAAKYCEPWSLIKNICGTQSGEAMTGMMGCSTFVKLCGNNVDTMVKQCTDGATSHIPSLPSTMNSLSIAVTVCGTSPPQTSTWCTANPCTTNDAPNCLKPFNTISDACIADSTASACSLSGWTTMCETDGGNLQKFCGSAFMTKKDVMTTDGMNDSGASRVSAASLLGAMFAAFAVIASRQ